MKTNLTSIFKAIAVFILTAVLLFNSDIIFAAGGKNFKTKANRYERMAENLKYGIQTGNAGLKKSCMQYAVFYQISDLDNILIKQLNEEKDSELRSFIVLSLFKIGSEKGYESIKALADKDENENVRKLCKEICNTMGNMLDGKIAQKNN